MRDGFSRKPNGRSAFASLVTWTVWLAKSLELSGARTRVGRTLKDIGASKILAQAITRVGRRTGPPP